MTVAIVAVLRGHYKRKAQPIYEFVTNHQPGPDIAFLLGQVNETNPQKQYRNPIHLAREWQSMITDGSYASSANLARHMGVSRARVTQVLGLLKLAPEVVEALNNLGDPLTSSIITERSLRPLVNLQPEAQMRRLNGILAGTMGASSYFPTLVYFRIIECHNE